MTARRSFDSDQLERLKVWFDINPSPSRSQVDHISSQMKVKSASVWMWFHSQRTRVKANQDISPQKVKTLSMSKVSSSATPHSQKVKTRPLSKRLHIDCNGNATTNRDARVEGTQDTRQERNKAKQGHIRGILNRRETRRGSGIPSAEEQRKGLPTKGVEGRHRQQMRVQFSEDSEVSTVNTSALMQRLGQDQIGLKAAQGSINRTEKGTNPQECVGVGPAQGPFKKKEKVAESLHHNRVRSFPRHGKGEERICDPQEKSAANITQRSIKKVVKETNSHLHIPEKQVQSSVSRAVIETDTLKHNRAVSNRTKPSFRKILKEADSQMLFRVEPVEGRVERTHKGAESQKHNGGKPAQRCMKGAEKVSEKERRLVSHSEKGCHLKQAKLTRIVKSMSVPKRIESSGNSSMNQGDHQRVKVPEEKSQTRVTAAPSCLKRTDEGETKLEKEKKPAAKRRLNEVQSSFEMNVHHRTAEKNLRQLSHRQVTDMSLNSLHIKKRKHKSQKEKRIKMLSHKAPNPAATKVKNSNMLQGTQETPEELLEESKVPSRTCTNRNRKGILSVLSVPKGKAEVDLSDYSDGEDFQDDQNKRTHQLSIKRKKMVDSVTSGKSIPVLSRQRQHSALVDCSERMSAGSNLRRIPLKPVSPAKCEVSSTSTSQSSVISSTVEEASDRLNDSCKGCQKLQDSSESNFEEKESKSDSGKRTGPVISDDKIWNPYHGNFLFKRELSVNLIKINLSSMSDEREVTVSSKVNPTSLLTGKKQSSQLCNDDKTDVNANMSVDFSSVPKATERSIWSSLASSLESSNKVWSSIASSTDTSHKEIPFIEEGAATLDQESNKLWSSIASSSELSHKEIPFIEGSASRDGESTPTSSQDCLEINKGQNRSNATRIFDEDSCEVSSSVDVEKIPVDLSDNMEEMEDTSSSVEMEKIEHSEKASADVMKTMEDEGKTSAEMTKTVKAIDKISTDTMGNMKEIEENSADLMVSKKEVEERPAESVQHMDVAKNTDLVNKTPREPDESKNDSRKVAVEIKERRGVEKLTADIIDTTGEIDRTVAEATESTEIDKEETDGQPDSGLRDLYEDITSPDYDICSPYMVVDEVICSDTESEASVTASQEEFSMESAQSAGKPASPSAPKVNEVIELDNCSDDDGEVIIVSASPAKRTIKESEKEPLNNQSLCNRKPVGEGMLALPYKPFGSSPTKCTCSNATENNDSPKVIDIDCCSDDNDEVILVSMQAPCVPCTKDVMNQKITKDSDSQKLDVDSSENVNGSLVKTISDEDVAKEYESFQSLDGIASSLDKDDNEEAPQNQGNQQDTCGTSPTPSIHVKDFKTESDPSIQNAGLDDIELDMSCDTISQIRTVEDDCMSLEKLDTSKEDLGCDYSSSSDELVIDTEACDRMECPLQENVSENITASASDAASVKQDTLKHQNAEADYPSSDELVLDIEAGDQVQCPQPRNDVSASIGDSQSDVAYVQRDTSEESEEDNSTSHKLVVNMEASDPIKCPQPGNDVSASISASQSDVAGVQRDTSERSEEVDNSTSNKLAIDIEAGDPMKFPQPGKDVSGSTSVSLKDVENVKQDTSELSAEADYSRSDVLIIDMEASDEKEYPQPGKVVSESIRTSASFSSAADAKWDKSEVSAEADYSTSDELVIDMEGGGVSQSTDTSTSCSDAIDAEQDKSEGDQMVYPRPKKGVSERIGASASSCSNAADAKQDKSEVSAEADYSLDELVIDMEAVDQMEYPQPEKDVSGSISASQSDVDNVKQDTSKPCVEADISTSEKLVINMQAGDQIKCFQPGKDVSDTTKSSSSEVVVGKPDSSEDLDIRSNVKEGQKLLAEMDQSGVSAGHDVAYVKAFDEMESRLQEKDGLENDVGASSDNAEAKRGPPLKSGLEDSASDEPNVDVTPCEQTECYLPESNAREPHTTAAAGDTHDRKLDPVEETLVHEDLTSPDELFINVTTCDQIMSSLQADAVSGQDDSASPSDAVEENTDQSEHNVVHKDSTSDHDLYIDVVTCDETECPPEGNAFPEKSSITSLGRSCQSEEEVVMSDVKSVRSVAGGVDQSPLDREITQKDKEDMSEAAQVPVSEETVMSDAKSSRSVAGVIDQGPLDRGSNLKDTKDTSKAEVPVPVKDSTPSSVNVEDTELQKCALNDATDCQLPNNDVRIRSQPDFDTNKDTTSGDTTLPNQENSTEKLKRPRTLNELVSDLTKRLGILVKQPTPTPRSVNLPYSSVGINPKACSAKSPSSSTQTAQPPKPTQEERRGKRRRVITNKNFKRPPIPEAVQLRIQELNPYPCDHSWMRNAAVVELAQKEAQLDCRPGETSSSTDHITGALLESSREPLLDTAGTTVGSLNFCYQPGMGPTNGDTKGATGKDSCSAIAASSSVNSSDQRVEVQPTEPSSNSINSHQSSIVKDCPILNDMLKTTGPLERKRLRTQSGDSKKKKKSRKRRRKSSDDIEWEISSKMNAMANRSFLEKDIREEWMELLRVMEESTFPENEEPPSNSGIVVPASSTTASASQGDPSSPTIGHRGGLLSEPLRVSEASSSTAPAPASASKKGQLPTTPDDQTATSSVSEAYSRTASASQVDDLSDMPSIVRVFSLREEEGQRESNPLIEPCGLGSFDPDSARILEQHGTPAHVYSYAAAAAAASAARRSQDSTDYASSLPSYQLTLNRKRHSSQTYGSTDGVPPSKTPATVETGPTSQDIPNLVVQQKQTNTNIGTQQAPSSCLRQSDNFSGALQTLASFRALNSAIVNEPSNSPKNSYVIKTPVVSPSSSLTQAATSVMASPSIPIAPKPVVTLISPQASAQPQVQPQQPSLMGSGTLQSLLNPLILNQEIQRRRLSASPPLCNPYPPSSMSASGQSGVTLNTLSAQPTPAGNVVTPGIRFLVRNAQGTQLPIPVNTQWSQPPPNVQLVPAAPQNYSNGLDSQSTTLLYTPQGSTITFLSGAPQ